MTRRDFIRLAAAGIGIAIVGECKLFDFAYDLGAKSAEESESEEDDDEEPPSPSPIECVGEGCKTTTKRKETTMARYHVIDPKNATYFEKPNGSRVWRLSESEAMRISEGAIVIALDERNFNESLNSYYCGKLFKQLHYDERNGWVS